MNDVAEEIQAISNLLDTAIEYGLETEVIYYALMAMKRNPEMKPVEAFAIGVTEWIK
jgi:hypothetical protein